MDKLTKEQIEKLKAEKASKFDKVVKKSGFESFAKDLENVCNKNKNELK